MSEKIPTTPPVLPKTINFERKLTKNGKKQRPLTPDQIAANAVAKEIFDDLRGVVSTLLVLCYVYHIRIAIFYCNYYSYIVLLFFK